MNESTAVVAEKLSAPFGPHEIKWKPAVVSGNRALALAYLTSRAIMDRLDTVVGITGWRDDYETLADGSVVCRLSLKIEGDWITKVDVGGQSEQPDEGDRHKAAFSDALKRAAVKFGIGRFLYSLPQQWCDYDPQKKQFTRQPALPSFLLPARNPDPPAKKLDTAGEEEVARHLAYLEAEVTNLDEMNAAYRYTSEKYTERGPLKKAIWEVTLEFAAQQGWSWSGKQVKFIPGEAA